MRQKIQFIILGLITGLFSAFFGIGGGVIIVPALIFIFKFKIKEAIGTSLFTIIPVSLIAVVSHYLINKANIAFSIGMLTIFGCLIGVAIGTYIETKLKSTTLKKIFGVFLIFVGIKMMNLIPLSFNLIEKNIWNLGIVGLMTGMESSLFGVGGGAILIPAYNLLFGLDMHATIATSLFVIFPTVTFGAFLHKKLDHYHPEAVKAIIPSAALGAICGAIVSNLTSTPNLKFLFGVFLVIIALELVFRKR